MKIFAGTLLAALFATGSANAQVLTFDFTAKVESMYEYDGSNIAIVTSSTLSGADVVNGDSVHGQFSFDLGTPLSTTLQFPQPANGSDLTYQGPQIQATISFDRPAYTFTTDNSGLSMIVVKDAMASNYDGFVLLANSYTPGMTAMRSIQVSLFDASGNAISGPSIPRSLPLSAFDEATIKYNWLRLSDGAQFGATAVITSLTPVVTSPVPEPSAYAMFAAGLLALGAIARRKAAAQR
ncbi:PEP-CTERM sorting domain-containing protein [Massilia mucilaginosa]|nr:PEP-CTERM sorting domain-containing protein [Massilia mucilaginosa]